VTNVFILDFETRLRSWAKLREEILSLDSISQVIKIDDFWQKSPIQNHYLHPDYIKDWPTPWQLLSDNVFCYYARALGIVYTLLLLGKKNIDLVDAVDDNSNEVVLVLVDDAKYVLNYWPNTVVNNHISNFAITRKHDITPLYAKIGQ
jgi:hypothetical protein